MAQPDYTRLFDATATAEGASPLIDVGARTFHTFVLYPLTGSPVLRIEGRMARRVDTRVAADEGAWQPVSYWEYLPNEARVTGPHVGSILGGTTIRIFYVIDPWREMRVYRGGGSSFVLDYFGQERDGGWLRTLSHTALTEIAQADPDKLQVAASLRWALEEVSQLHPIPTEVMNPPDDLLERIIAAVNALELATTVNVAPPIIPDITTVRQSDPNVLNVAAHLKIELEDVNDLHRLPVATELEALLQAIYDLMEVPFETQWLDISGIVTGAAYADGDAFGTGNFVALPSEGVIEEVQFQDRDDEGSAYEMAFFRSPLATIPTDNSAFAPTDDDLERYAGHLNIASSDQANWSTGRGGQTFVPDFRFRTPAVGGFMVYWIAKGTPNIAAANLPTFKIKGRTKKKGWSAS